MDERELTASLAAIGPILPVLIYAGETIDGRKRARVCAALELEIETIELATLQDACAKLYAQHPARAVALAQRHGITQLRALAEHCGSTVAAIAREIKAKKKPVGGAERVRRLGGHSEMRRLRKTPEMVLVRAYLEPELRAYGHELAKTRGHGNLSRVIRDALWKEVAMLPRAQLHQPRRVKSQRKAG